MPETTSPIRTVLHIDEPIHLRISGYYKIIIDADQLSPVPILDLQPLESKNLPQGYSQEPKLSKILNIRSRQGHEIISLMIGMFMSHPDIIIQIGTTNDAYRHLKYSVFLPDLEFQQNSLFLEKIFTFLSEFCHIIYNEYLEIESKFNLPHVDEIYNAKNTPKFFVRIGGDITPLNKFLERNGLMIIIENNTIQWVKDPYNEGKGFGCSDLSTCVNSLITMARTIYRALNERNFPPIAIYQSYGSETILSAGIIYQPRQLVRLN